MKRTVTTYTCDCCEGTVERPRDLRKFSLVGSSPGGNRRYRDAPTFEVCGSCEDNLLAAVKPFVSGDKQLENLTELARVPVA